MPPQAAAAAPLSQDDKEQLPQQEGAVEAKKGPESPFDRVLDSENPDPEKVVSIFRGRADKEKEALAKLGQFEPTELGAVPEAMTQAEAANDATYKKIDAAEEQAVMEVVKVLPVMKVEAAKPVEAIKPTPTVAVGEAAPLGPNSSSSSFTKEESNMSASLLSTRGNEGVSAQVEAPAPVAAAAIEAVKVMPVMKVGEPVAPEASPAELARKAEAEEQRDVAAELIREEFDALSKFCKEHNVTIDLSDPTRLTIPESELNKLQGVEKFYVQVLLSKHQAGNASLRHAEKLLEAYALPENSVKRESLMQEAAVLAQEAEVREMGATVMQNSYLQLPEIAALAAGGAGGNGTGGSIGGGNFEGQKSPFDQEPKGTAKGTLGGPLVGGTPGSGLAQVTAYKSPDATVTKKPFFGSTVGGWLADLTFGKFKSGGGSRE